MVLGRVIVQRWSGEKTDERVLQLRQRSAPGRTLLHGAKLVRAVTGQSAGCFSGGQAAFQVGAEFGDGRVSKTINDSGGDEHVTSGSYDGHLHFASLALDENPVRDIAKQDSSSF